MGRKYIGLRCVDDHVRNPDGSVLLYFTDIHVDGTTELSVNWVEILMVGEECRYVTQERLANWQKKFRVMMVFPEWGHGVDEIVDDLWWVDERLIEDDNPQLSPYVVLEPLN